MLVLSVPLPDAVGIFFESMPADVAQSLPSRADRGDKVIPEGGAARGWQALDFLGPDFLFVDLAVQSAENLFRLVKFKSRTVV